MEDQDFVVVPDRSPLSKQLNINSQSSSLRLYIEWCRSMKKWEEMTEYIGDSAELTETQNYIEWALEPQSISSLIVTYLYLELAKNPEGVLKHVENVIIEVVRGIECNPEDFRDCSLFLLNKFLDHASEKTVAGLVKFGVFEVLAKILVKSDEKLMDLLVEICVKIYTNREFAQVNFIDNDGVSRIVHILSETEGNSEAFIEKVVKGSLVLVKLDPQGLNPRVLTALKDSNLSEILKTLKKVKKSPSLKQDCKELLTILVNN